MDERVEFLLARIGEREAEVRRWGTMVAGHRFQCCYEGGFEGTTECDCGAVEFELAECDAKRAIIERHKQWPVLADLEERDAVRSSDEGIFGHITQRMAWLTNQEYVARFGTAPPTNPVIDALLQPYDGHPDFKAEWRQ